MQPLAAGWETGLCIPEVPEKSESQEFGLIWDYQRLDRNSGNTGLKKTVFLHLLTDQDIPISKQTKTATRTT